MVTTLASTFAWLDTSERDRRRALDVIDLFALRDTRDELGIAAVRDSWADRLAPGTSTIQTRDRYFLFIPWIYQRLWCSRNTCRLHASRPLPASGDFEQSVALQHVQRSLALYRMVFGQPRQDDLMAFLLRQVPERALEKLLGELRVDLCPRVVSR